MLEHFRILGINMNIKVHFLHSHLDQSPENIRDIGNEQGEQFHHDIKTTEKRYQGRCHIKMMAEYCWNLKRDKPDSGYSKKSKKNANFPHIKDNILDFQDQQWLLIFYLKFVSTWCNKKQSCKELFKSFFFCMILNFFWSRSKIFSK